MAQCRLTAIDPRWRLATCVLGLAFILLLRTPLCAGLALVGSVVLALWSGIPLAWYCRRYAALLPVVLFIAAVGGLFSLGSSSAPALSPISGSLRGIWLFVFKISAIFLFLLVLIAAAPFHEMLAAASSLGVPGSTVWLTRLTHRYTFLLAQEFTRLRTALKIRGSRRPGLRGGLQPFGQIVGALLVRSSERAVRVGNAMACRGHGGSARSLREPRTTTREVGFFVIVCGVSGAILLFDFWERA